MPSTEEQTGSSRPVPLCPGLGGTEKRLTRLQSALAELLCVIDEDARQTDANLDDAHNLVQSLRTLAKQRLFWADGHACDSQERRAYHAFERARAVESDAHEVFAGDLERFRKRQRLDLSVAESDSDTSVLVKGRRAYISALLAYQTALSGLLDSVANPLMESKHS